MKFIDDMRKLKTNNIRHKYFEEIPLSSSESLDHANIIANKFIIEKSYLKIFFYSWQLLTLGSVTYLPVPYL